MYVNKFLTIVFFLVAIFSSSSTFAQKKEGEVFKSVNAKMTVTINKHLQQYVRTPYQMERKPNGVANGLYTTVHSLSQVFNIKKDDFSFNIDDPKNTFIIILKLEQSIRPAQRWENDALKDATVKRIITSHDNVSSVQHMAGFVLIRDRKGDFEVQEVETRDLSELEYLRGGE